MHNFTYVGQGQYPNSVKAGLRAGTKAPNGVRIHYPRDLISHYEKDGPALIENNRIYVLWLGEPIETVFEACAFVLSITRGKEIYVVRCNRATCDEHYHGGNKGGHAGAVASA